MGTRIHRAFIAALLGLGLGASTAAQAGALADLSIVNRSTGQTLPVYQHQGRYYVAGTPGDKYAVAVRNKTEQRLMAVISVDGVNVVSGETAAPTQTGYVLGAGFNYAINGWRKSTDEVAAFVFTALPDSYAARTERPGNVGVIGVAVFREYQPPRPAPWSAPWPAPGSAPYGSAAPSSFRDNVAAKSTAATADAAPAAASAEARRAEPANAAVRPREEALGTGHGERELSSVSYTDFRRASERPAEVIAIYYDSYRNLLARGVIPAPRREVPSPFPAGNGFVPDPAG